ncbi:MAG: KEOPS complex subunit Pcc1 [Thermoprotei archaeon]|nr:KEOPS complex subunit Pcc1 [Thermoprotei archaeon]
MGEEVKCTAKLKIKALKAKTLEEALEPDNIITPPGLKVGCKSRDDTLECTVEVECGNPTRILTLRNTIEDLLTTIKAVVETLAKTS